jgi:aerobic-type carbon monoxide dehydrogenase small subunit (CoxS/CutS family)
MPIDLDATAVSIGSPIEIPIEVPIELKVTFTVDDEEYCVDAWPDLSALRTIRDVARHPRPRRGCEMGLCGSCESKVDGVERRLCQMTSASLDGVVIETPTPRRSMFAV